MNDTYPYDVALSFAGEDRPYVEQVAVNLRNFGVKVFYDSFEEVDLWGKNLIDHLQAVYQTKARFTVMFISEHYDRKVWTNHERKAAQARAFTESREYILPARFDNTEIQGLYSTLSYIDLNKKTPAEFAQIICLKIGWVTKNRWWGKWEVDSVSPSYSALVEIRDVTTSHFSFKIQIVHGSHLGDLSGTAYFIGHNNAVFKNIRTFDDHIETCVITFFKTNDIIQIDETNACLEYHGLRAYFSGDYRLKKDVFFQFDPLDDLILSKIYKAVGPVLWEEFIKCFGDTHIDSHNAPDEFVITGGVPGMYTIYEAILKVRKNKTIHGAFLDVDTVYYFSSSSTGGEHIPDEFSSWWNRFSNKTFVALTPEYVESLKVGKSDLL
jgi:hypothetical protein